MGAAMRARVAVLAVLVSLAALTATAATGRDLGNELLARTIAARYGAGYGLLIPFQSLPNPELDAGAATKDYYRDLFAGRLGFQLVKTFKTYPSLFGYPINDDDAELTFRLFDHPRVFIFRRQ